MRFVIIAALIGWTSASHAAPPAVLDGSDDAIALLPHTEVLVDSQGTLDVGEVASRPFASFAATEGQKGAAWWLRFVVQRPSTTAGSDWYLGIGPPTDPAELFVPEGDTWRRVSLVPDPRGGPTLVKLDLPQGTHPVFLRLRQLGAAPILFHLATLRGHLRLEGQFVFAQGLYFGLVTLVLLANLLIFLINRERAHLWYVAFVALTATYFAVRFGLLSRFLSPEALTAAALARPELTLLALVATAGSQFSRRFLETARLTPRADRGLRLYGVVALIALPVVWLAPLRPATLLLASIGVLLPLVALSAGVASWRAGSRWARFYLAGWACFTLGTFVFAVPLPLITSPVAELAAFQLGSALEVFFLALALVDRLRILRGDLVQARAQLVRSEKLATLGQLVAGVAHEVNNPNNFITFNLPILKDYLDALRPHAEAAAAADPELRIFGMTVAEFFADGATLIAHMQHGAERITGIVGELKAYARGDEEAAFGIGPLNPAVERAAALVRKQLERLGPRLVVQLDPALPAVSRAEGRIEQVVVNLLLNAAQAATGRADGRVTLCTRREAGWVLIEVADNGPGVPAALQKRIFEPFFTTKGREGGIGMGLAVSLRIVEAHGGRIELASGDATRFIVRLPVAEEV
ncbi:MAG: hypothetical protein KC620_11665 [Myxococcales bacterium]|nr:hypothetical protein [Myxococcales bacterium]